MVEAAPQIAHKPKAVPLPQGNTLGIGLTNEQEKQKKLDAHKEALREQMEEVKRRKEAAKEK